MPIIIILNNPNNNHNCINNIKKNNVSLSIGVPRSSDIIFTDKYHQ